MINTVSSLLAKKPKFIGSIIKIKKYRQAGAGAGSTTTTKASRIAQMKAMNSAYMEYCVSSFERYDYVNKEVPEDDFEPYYAGAMIAGLRYANNVGMDVVFKSVNIQGHDFFVMALFFNQTLSSQK